MRSLRLFVGVAALCAAASGCFESHGDELRFRDGGPRDAPPMLESCGDGVLDPREACDDGNTTPGDGCDAFCRREALCGNGVLEADEVCDDGNNASGDGCRSDCRSTEACGNGLIDTVAGEVCDDGNTVSMDGCAADCRRVETCGDGVEDPGEQCDDGNEAAFDGCGPDCRVEVGLVVTSLAIGASGTGCDFSGDGVPDNALADALGFARTLLNDQFLQGAVQDGELTLLLQLLALDDLSGADDDSLTVRLGPGEAAGEGHAWSAPPEEAAAFQSTITMRHLEGGPDDLTIPIELLPLELERARIEGTTEATGGELSAITDGALCGTLPIQLLASVPNFLDLLDDFGFGVGGEPCDESVESTTLVDLFLGGFELLGLSALPGAAPDVDVDGDGLEEFELATEGPEGCQPVLTACIDGDGTRVEGHDCATDPRFADGFSVGLSFEATRTDIVGVN